MTHAARIGDDIKIEARDWLLRLTLETPTADDRQRFEAWIAQDPRHAAAYQRFQSIWQDTAQLQELKALAPLENPRQSWTRSLFAGLRARPLLWAAQAGIAAAVGIVGAWLFMRPTHYDTDIAQIRQIQLSDGSAITIGARSSLEVKFRGQERHVTLTAGEAFFSVEKDPARPFVVEVADKKVRVLGTQFEVHRDEQSVRVAVLQGTVAVSQAAAPQLLLTAGQQMTADLAGASLKATTLNTTEAAAWRRGRLVYVDAPLREIVADANRYSRLPITLTDPAVADLRVSVTYPTDHIVEMLAALSRSLPITIDHRDGSKILISPAAELP